jgi:hypothetical protein
MQYLNYLKDFYGIVGAKHPTLSLALASLLGAILFGGSWIIVGRLYSADQAAAAKTPSSHAEVSGDCSSATAGNGNTTNITCAPPKDPKK